MASSTPSQQFRMTGHVVIVTGGAQNIGAGIARTFSGAGAKVMIADLNGDKAEATAAGDRGETGNDCRGMDCDVTDGGRHRRVVAATVEGLRRHLDAGQQRGLGPGHEDPLAISDEEIIASYKLNTISANRMTVACLPHLLKADERHDHEFGLDGRRACRPTTSSPMAAKAALNQMMLGSRTARQEGARQLRADRHGDDARIRAMPGSTRSSSALAHPDNLTGRAGSAEDVANAMLWLARRPAAG